MENELRILEFDGIQFAAFLEWHTNNEHPGYYHSTILFHAEQGQLNIRDNQRLYTIPKGHFCIVRKLTELNYFKTWEDHEDCAKINAMALKDEFINEAIRELGYKIPNKSIKDPVVTLGNNAVLLGLYQSLATYLTEDQPPNKHLMYLKTKEALLGIIQSNPEHLAIFHEFSKPVKANLQEFMHHHSLLNLPLKELAKLSGRSLSTFNRDFRKIFNATPHNWLLKKRLNKAKELLLISSKTASEICLELGFKDLGHFSRAFKKEFGLSPSAISKLQT